MNDFEAAKLEPFKPRQCMHWNSDGIRCRAYACRNEYTCFHHRIEGEPAIFILANDPFTLPSLVTREGVQQALDAVTARLAGKTIDDRRAALLVYAIQIASNQLPRPAAAHPAPAVPNEAVIPSEVEGPPHLASPATEPAVPSNLEPRTSKPPEPPIREYTENEKLYLFITGVTGRSPGFDRPASLSDEDVEAYLTHRRWALQQEENAKHPGKARKPTPAALPATLPSLHAVGAEPSNCHPDPELSTPNLYRAVQQQHNKPLLSVVTYLTLVSSDAIICAGAEFLCQSGLYPLHMQGDNGLSREAYGNDYSDRYFLLCPLGATGGGGNRLSVRLGKRGQVWEGEDVPL